MDKRYQIFISSTFEDLKDERAKVMETILNNDCFPAGMEMFPAMDEKQFEYIKRIIDDSDYFLLIIGGRYGSVDEKGVSWTEKEYDYAIHKGIHVLVFDHEDYTSLPANKTERSVKKQRKLEAFKKKASKNKLIKQWSNADNLALMVSNSLKRVFELHPGKGWVRKSSVVSKDSQGMINLLQTELNNIQEKYRAAQKKIDLLIDENRKYKVREMTESFKVEGVSFNMIRIEGGKFIMGDNNHLVDTNDDKPPHEVTLSGFSIGETQVTQALWVAVMGDNPSFFVSANGYKDDFDRPVECVSWDDCKVFIARLNKKMKELGVTGIEFRLPTEAEWEFAARGGNFGKENDYGFAGSKNVSEVAWYCGNSNNETHPVAKYKKSNELGLYDMSGNVWEWCEDWYGPYSNELQYNPKGPVSGSNRVRRGGSWNFIFDCSHVFYRSFSKPDDTRSHIGLRLAYSPTTNEND